MSVTGGYRSFERLTDEALQIVAVQRGHELGADGRGHEAFRGRQGWGAVLRDVCCP